MPRSGLRIGSFHGPPGFYQRDLGTVHPPDNYIPPPTFDLGGPFAGFPEDTVIVNGVAQVGQGQVLPPGVVPPKEWRRDGMVYSPYGNYYIPQADPISPHYNPNRNKNKY